MTTRKRILGTIVCAVALLMNAIGIVAQEKTVKTESKFVTVEVPPGQVASGGFVQGDNTFVFVSSEMSFDGKLVKGAPYSAQAINENVQVLAGGNRIVHQNTSSIYRDSEGRTRRDQTLSVVGGYAAAGDPIQTTFINDPVAGVNYILDAKNRTARKIDVSIRLAAEKKMAEGMKARSAEGAPTPDQAARQKAEAGVRFEMRTHGPGMGPMGPVGGESGFMMMKADPKNSRKESLGKQTIEGVEAEGTRITTTIPAGEIGNEQPIEIVSESWYSPDLQTVVMSTHSDPRIGEHTYRLTNINRSEPPHSLFEVPADYTVQEAGPPADVRYRIEREMRRPGSNQ